MTTVNEVFFILESRIEAGFPVTPATVTRAFKHIDKGTIKKILRSFYEKNNMERHLQLLDET